MNIHKAYDESRARTANTRTLLKYFLFQATFLLAGITSYGQMYSVTGGTGGNAFPLASTATNKCQFLYRPTYFPTAPAGNITKIYIMSQNALPAGATFTNLAVKMSTTAATGFATGNFASPLTTVYTAATTTLATPIVAGGWLPVTLTTPFPWGMTDNLIVEISQTGYTNGLTILYNSNIAAARHYGAVTATTGTAGAGLLNFGYDLVTTPCSGTPPPANAVASSTNPCLGSTVILNASPANLLTGISYQWQEFDGTGWINAVGGTGATAASYLTPAIIVPKRYRAKMNCTLGTYPETISAEVLVSPGITPIPYAENFESITAADQMPQCMRADLIGSGVRTYITNQTSYNRNNHTAGGSKFASVYFSPAGTQGIYTPAFNLTGGKSYLFRFWYVTGNVSNTAPAIFTSLGAYYGTTPDIAGMTNLISAVPTSPVNSTAYQEFSEAFTPAATGTYYVGILAAHTAAAVAYLSIDDIALDSLTPCVGRPSAGTVTSATPCAGQNFTLSRNGGSSVTTTGNLSYQWQDSTHVGWQNSLGPSATSNSFTTSVTTTTIFRVIITCTNSGLSDTSAGRRINLASFILCYCNSSATLTADDDIGNVTIASLPGSNILLNNGIATPLTSNATSANLYSNFFNTVAPPTLYPDSSYRISMTQINSGTFFACRGFGYIDYDHSGTFDPSELIIDRPTAATSTPANIITQNYTVPNNAKFGLTAMRLILAEGTTTALNPCLSYNWGETEDYLVNIAFPPCTGPANAGSAFASETAICKGYTINVWDTTHEVQRSRITWSWQSSVDGGLSWNSIAGSVGKDTLNNILINGSVSYRLKMVCDATGDSTFSTPASVTIKAPYACYCYSQSDGGSTDTSDIGAIEIGAMVNSTGGPHVSNPVAIYRRSDYTGISNVILNANNRYRLSMYHTQRNGIHADARVSVFIDYNNNLQYEANASPNSERVYTGISTENNFYIDTVINVPDAVIPNAPTGLRVILNNDLNPNSPANLGCGAYASGETEDYIVQFNRVPAGINSTMNLENVMLYPNPTNGKFTILANAGKAMEQLNIRVITITGQLIRQVTHSQVRNKFATEIDLSNAARGIYFIEIKTRNGDRMVRKLIVQ